LIPLKTKPINILIIGSAPSALAAKNWDLSIFNRVVVINNAWKITPLWTDSIFPEDFPVEKRPSPNITQNLHSAEDYVQAQNYFGGFVYAGGTMAFTAAYWSLYTFSPSLIVYLGCDMLYSGLKTHFYGKGTPDPLRDDKTLKNLRAKSARFECIAAEQKCTVLNLSKLSKSNLVHRRITINDLKTKNFSPKQINLSTFTRVLKMEKEINYFVSDGKYWKKMDQFKLEVISKLDSLWLEALNEN